MYSIQINTQVLFDSFQIFAANVKQKWELFFTCNMGMYIYESILGKSCVTLSEGWLYDDTQGAKIVPYGGLNRSAMKYDFVMIISVGIVMVHCLLISKRGYQ